MLLELARIRNSFFHKGVHVGMLPECARQDLEEHQNVAGYLFSLICLYLAPKTYQLSGIYLGMECDWSGMRLAGGKIIGVAFRVWVEGMARRSLPSNCD